MSEEKIRVSWEELSQPDVDRKVKQQETFAQAQQHYVPPPIPTAPGAGPSAANRGSVWYNTLVYMPVFGLMGGLLAWAVGEGIQAIPNRLEEYHLFRQQETALLTALERGEISKEASTQRAHALKRKYSSNPYFQWNQSPSKNDAEKALYRKSMVARDELLLQLRQLFYFATLGAAISLFLSISDATVARNLRASVINGSLGAVLGFAGGFVVWLFIDRLYTTLGGGQGGAAVAMQIAARSLGWAILGMFLAIAPGVVLKNWKRLLVGLAGGLLGGLVGGLLFDPIANLTNSGLISRLIVLAVIGLITGAGTGLIEMAAKTGWLKVAAGLIGGKQFVLYKNPTLIGSSPQCEIYLFKDPQVGPRHAAIYQVPGGFELEDLGSSAGTVVNGRPVSRQRLHNNDQIQVGSTSLVFQERNQT